MIALVLKFFIFALVIAFVVKILTASSQTRGVSETPSGKRFKASGAKVTDAEFVEVDRE